VVAAKTHETKALSGSPKVGESTNSYSWENSNKLLGKHEGVLGCKTGITNAAGPCFAGYYENEDTDTKLAIILCHSKSLEARWLEVEQMINWYKSTVLEKLNK
jgi:D-alanyl-D-alanine carboxypeptidase